MTRDPQSRSAVHDMPPLPRDSGSSLMSEVIPLNSRSTRFWKSRALVPSLVVVVVMLLLFSMPTDTVAQSNLYARILGFLILFVIFYGVHAYTGSRRPVWVFALPFAFTLASMTVPLAFVIQWPIFGFFRDVLPGGEVPEGVDSFTAHFVSHFFGAGMAEETLKIVPVLLMIGFGVWAGTRLQWPLGRAMKAFEASTVLDCVLAAMASGAAFILIETFGQYYYGQIERSLQQGGENQTALVLGVVNALQLSIPRSLQGIVGHMAWTGIFAYFIGIGLRRKSLLLPLGLLGLVLSSAMHGFWNSSWFLLGTAGIWVSALTTLVLFLAVLLKAKQLEPGSQAVAGGSIVATGAPQSGGQASAWNHSPQPAAAELRPSPARPSAMNGFATATPVLAESLVGTGLSLLAGGHVVPLAVGQPVGFAGLSGLPAIAGSFSGTVSVHPTDPSIIGLTNLGPKPWALFSPSGASQTVEPNRTARLEAGTRIVLGDLVASIIKQD